MNSNNSSEHIAYHMKEHNKIHSLNKRRKRNLLNTKLRMNKQNMNPDDFSAFTASLSNLNQKEIRQAKVLYIKNAITSYKLSCQNKPFFLLWIGSISIFMFFGAITDFPLFALLPLLFLFEAFSNIKNSLRARKQKIANAIEIWKDDLGDDYFKFEIELDKIKANVPIVNIPIV